MNFYAPAEPDIRTSGAFISRIADTAREYQFYFDRLCELFGPPNDPFYRPAETSKKYHRHWILKHRQAQGTLEIYTHQKVFRLAGSCPEKAGELLELIDPEAFAGFGAFNGEDLFNLNFPPQKTAS